MRSNLLLGIACLLAIIGAINWGLVGLFSFDLVAAIFGPGSIGARIVYVLVAIAGLVLIPEMIRLFGGAQRPVVSTTSTHTRP